MGKCIEELYDEMQEKIVSEICENDEINNLWNELNKLDEILKNSIGKEEYKIFDEYLYNEAGLIEAERRQAFVYGFKLANRLIVESLEN